MKVIKRSGETQDVQLDKLTERIQKLSKGLSVDPVVVAKKTADGLFDMITTTEIDKMLIQTSAFMTSNDPDYSKLAGRILSSVIEKEVQNQDIDSFTDYIKVAVDQELISDETAAKASKYKVKISHILNKKRNDLFEYFGLKTVYDRYLLKHPQTRKAIETPQYFFMRVAIGLSNNFNEIEEVYETISSHEAMLSTPTLFNSGTKKAQMSSCYLLDSPEDSLAGIFGQVTEIANLSKWAGGIGLSYSKVRSRGSLIKGTNGLSNGVVPWLKVLDATMASVNQGGKRKGAACVYLESWHPDIMEFLELRDNTGDHESRTHNLNLANWIPDLFMKRVKEDGMWSLFDPKSCTLTDKYGEDFETEYLSREESKKYVRQIKARDLYARMMTTLAQTGNGWMCFKDSANKKSNQTENPENIIHSSNLCLDGNTLVLTSRGDKRISSLVGQEVTIFDGNNWIKIDSFKMTHKSAEVLKIVMNDNSEIICTPYHKIPLSNGVFIEAKDVIGGMQIRGLVSNNRPTHKTVKAVVSLSEKRPVYCCLVPTTNMFALANGMMTGNCSEILEVTNEAEIAVCNLGSINLSKFVKNKTVDFEKIASTAKKMIRTLDRVIDKNFYPVPKAKKSNNKWRPVGLGIMGLQDVFFMLDIPFDSTEALKVSTEIQKTIYYAALEASALLAKSEGPCDAYKATRTGAAGKLQPDLWGLADDPKQEGLRTLIDQHGLRNSLLIAIAPTATIASIVGCYECIEPQTSNMFKRETLSGEFLQVNKYLVMKLKELNLWNDEVRNKIITNEGSVAGIDKIPLEIQAVYKTVWEISMKDLIQMAADRSPYIDQSQSLNLFIESPTIGKLSSMYMFVWEKGLKTTYYLRSRPATKIKKTIESEKPIVEPSTAISCSLENPEACESCQ